MVNSAEPKSWPGLEVIGYARGNMIERIALRDVPHPASKPRRRRCRQRLLAAAVEAALASEQAWDVLLPRAGVVALQLAHGTEDEAGRAVAVLNELVTRLELPGPAFPNASVREVETLPFAGFVFTRDFSNVLSPQLSIRPPELIARRQRSILGHLVAAAAEAMSPEHATWTVVSGTDAVGAVTIRLRLSKRSGAEPARAAELLDRLAERCAGRGPSPDIVAPVIEIWPALVRHPWAAQLALHLWRSSEAPE